MPKIIHWCTYSEEGLKWLRPRKPYRIGKWIRKVNFIPRWGSNRPPCVVVHWLGNKNPMVIAESYIRIFTSSEPYSGELPEIPVIPHLLQSKLWRAHS
jgi:hypothetical protein